MSTFFSLAWKGDLVLESTKQAAISGVEYTLQQAVDIAKPLTPVLTGRLQSSIDILDHAHDEGGVIKGSFGTDVDYGIWVEIGNHGRPGVYMLQTAWAEASNDLATNMGGFML